MASSCFGEFFCTSLDQRWSRNLPVSICVQFLLSLLQCCFCVMFWLFGHTTQDLSSWTREQIHTSCLGRQSLNHWNTKEVPYFPFS